MDLLLVHAIGISLKILTKTTPYISSSTVTKDIN